MRKELTYQTLKHNTKNTAQGTSVTNHQTEHIQNSPYSTTVKNRTEPSQNSARGITVPSNHAEHIQDGAQNTNGKTFFQNTFKRVRKALTYQRNIQNTFKTVRNTLT